MLLQESLCSLPELGTDYTNIGLTACTVTADAVGSVCMTMLGDTYYGCFLLYFKGVTWDYYYLLPPVIACWLDELFSYEEMWTGSTSPVVIY